MGVIILEQNSLAEPQGRSRNFDQVVHQWMCRERAFGHIVTTVEPDNPAAIQAQPLKSSGAYVNYNLCPGNFPLCISKKCRGKSGRHFDINSMTLHYVFLCKKKKMILMIFFPCLCFYFSHTLLYKQLAETCSEN